MSSQYERSKVIDIAKGLAIISVVIGHSYSDSNVVTQWINSFHMPFFFLISGVLYGRKEFIEKNLKIKFRKKMYSLLIPYVIFAVTYQSLLAVLQYIHGESLREVSTQVVKSVICLEGGAVWFLPSLLIAEFIFGSTIKSKFLNITTVGIISVIGFIYPTFEETLLNSVLRAFVGCMFIAIGFYSWKIWMKPVKNNISIIIVALCHIILAIYNDTVLMIDRKWGSSLLFIIDGILGSYILMQVSRILNKKNKISDLLSYCGENSIIILCLHLFIIEIVRLLDYRVLGNLLPSLGILEGIFFASLQLVMLIPIIFPCNKYWGWIFGKKGYKACINKKI